MLSLQRRAKRGKFGGKPMDVRANWSEQTVMPTRVNWGWRGRHLWSSRSVITGPHGARAHHWNGENDSNYELTAVWLWSVVGVIMFTLLTWLALGSELYSKGARPARRRRSETYASLV